MKDSNLFDFFEGRSLVIATKHSKESVIAPILQENLGVKCFVPDDFDTDLFGTFTGEVNREKDPVSTVKEKCLKAMERTGCDLGLANEGSFGAHPTMFFAKADDEFMILIDRKNNLEILVRELSTDTNFNASFLKTSDDLEEFLTTVGFPSHKVILRKNASDANEIYKDITSRKQLLEVFDGLIQKYGQAYAETDMRAMNNPTRMGVIEKLTSKLIDRLTQRCPNCVFPGYGVVNVRSGLPCSWCNEPTDSTLSHVYECQHCLFVGEEMFPNGKTAEDPMYCNRCNP